MARAVGLEPDGKEVTDHPIRENVEGYRDQNFPGDARRPASLIVSKPTSEETVSQAPETSQELDSA